MRRRLFNFAAAVSLALFVANAVLRVGGWSMNSISRTIFLRSDSIWLFRNGCWSLASVPLERQPDGSLGAKVNSEDFNFPSDPPWLIVRTVPYPQSRRFILIVLPARTLAVVFAVLPAIWLFTRRKAAPCAAGTCSRCGYNLTGNTSGVCPECGTPIAEKAGA